MRQQADVPEAAPEPARAFRMVDDRTLVDPPEINDPDDARNPDGTLSLGEDDVDQEEGEAAAAAVAAGGDPTRDYAEQVVGGFRKARSESEVQRLPRRTRPPSREEIPDEPDPMQRAQLLVQVHLAREAERRFRQGSGARDRDGLRTRDGEDGMEPWQVIPRIREIDETAPVDPVTGGYPADIKAGYVTHWVSLRDDHDRPTTSRLAKRQRYGYVTVKDAEGEPIEGRLGMLMQAPVEASAAYTLAGMPRGAMKRDEALAQAQDMDAELQAVGEAYGGIVVEREHQHKRGTVTGMHTEYPE